ncbi:hypothetical protein B0H34DRAFT_736661 [Crassisporium funariophilum]|nr:hypothetical protein B0H34DRAFT_736661 [Crassisporium funariophilum]
MFYCAHNTKPTTQERAGRSKFLLKHSHRRPPTPTSSTMRFTLSATMVAAALTLCSMAAATPGANTDLEFESRDPKHDHHRMHAAQSGSGSSSPAPERREFEAHQRFARQLDARQRHYGGSKPRPTPPLRPGRPQPGLIIPREHGHGRVHGAHGQHAPAGDSSPARREELELEARNVFQWLDARTGSHGGNKPRPTPIPGPVRPRPGLIRSREHGHGHEHAVHGHHAPAGDSSPARREELELEARGLRSWIKGKMQGAPQHQVEARELEARGLRSWIKGKMQGAPLETREHGHGHGGHGKHAHSAPAGDISSAQRRDLELETIMARGFIKQVICKEKPAPDAASSPARREELELEARGLRSWIKGKMQGAPQHQDISSAQRRDLEIELVVREAIMERGLLHWLICPKK